MIHLFDWVDGGGALVVLLGINIDPHVAVHHAAATAASAPRRSARISPALYAVAAALLHPEALRGSANASGRGLVHLALMLSYVTMLVLIMFFLRDMAAGPPIDWRVHVFGYLAVGRPDRGRDPEPPRADATRCRPSTHIRTSRDWMFLVLLLVVALTGVLQHVLHRSGPDAAANVTYVVHLMAVVPMLGLEVPFGKWAHMAYRPLAVYFAQVQVHAEATEAEKAEKAERIGAEAASVGRREGVSSMDEGGRDCHEHPDRRDRDGIGGREPTTKDADFVELKRCLATHLRKLRVERGLTQIHVCPATRLEPAAGGEDGGSGRLGVGRPAREGAPDDGHLPRAGRSHHRDRGVAGLLTGAPSAVPTGPADDPAPAHDGDLPHAVSWQPEREPHNVRGSADAFRRAPMRNRRRMRPLYITESERTMNRCD